jgi:hypothetical protein
VTPLPTNTSAPAPPETHSAATDAPTVDLDGTDAAAKPEADDTADIDDTLSDGVGPANNGWQQVELAWLSERGKTQTNIHVNVAAEIRHVTTA